MDAKTFFIKLGRRLPPAILALSPKRIRSAVKGEAEYSYWRERLQSEGKLTNHHYEHFFTAFFDLSPSHYEGMRILDIGCGPRGSLEWADIAKERVGLDPLVSVYKDIGIDCHKMTYVCAPSEEIPFPSEHFDFVTSFNSLDHVDDHHKTLAEISRVLRPNGRFLLIVEVNHPPTTAEPVSIDYNALKARLLDEYRFVSFRCYDLPADHNIYRALKNGSALPSSFVPTRQAILAANLVKLETKRLP